MDQHIQRTLITFKQGSRKFTYRVGGIALHKGFVLFQKATADPYKTFWFLPGGRAELGESAFQALQREMLEELHVPVTVERPVFLLENFYEEDAVLHHELGIYFLMQLPPDCYLCQQEGPFIQEDEMDLPLIFEWLPLDRLTQLAIEPKFFCTALQALSAQFAHIVYTDS